MYMQRQHSSRAWVAFLGPVLLLLVSSSAASARTALYLHSDGVPVASLSTEAPTAVALPNHDPGRDAYPGLLVARGGSGASETDPSKYQQWITPSGVSLDGPTSLVFWAGIKEFASATRGVVEAFLLDCDSVGDHCSVVAQSRKDIFDWSERWGSWSEHSVEFGHVTHAVSEGRSLSVKIVVGADSDDDMWFAYGSADYPGRLTDEAASDVVVDCDFTDWIDARGTEFYVADQGGADDWWSPASLDLTAFAVSSNLVDTLQVLIGFDDVPPQSTKAATIIDTDLDGNADYSFVVTMDGADSTVELYACDNSTASECSGALLEMTYPPSYFCLTTASGPWDADSFVEVALPFNDLRFSGGGIVLTSLVSYAAEPLLISAKDSILGAGSQDYDGGVYYDTIDGTASLVGPIAPGFVVRRSTDPAGARTAQVHATVYQAPFDDVPGSLDDGVVYYYSVERTGGVPLRLSSHANRYENAVRIGFDDNDVLTAPVNDRSSGVFLDTESVSADGTSAITVTVVPRDSRGTPIGAGCDVIVDELPLGPGRLAGPVRDNQDGSYTLRVTSLDPGSGRVVVSVEGIDLDSEPQITFTAF
jgi:hypothetical protein